MKLGLARIAEHPPFAYLATVAKRIRLGTSIMQLARRTRLELMAELTGSRDMQTEEAQ